MYEILLTSSAVKDYKNVTDDKRNKINDAIDSLAKNPRPHGYKKLTGRDAYRIRVGDYRILYEINDKELLILVIRIQNRKEVYRNL